MVIWQPEIDNAEHPYPIFTRSGWEIPQPTIDEVDQAQQDLGDVRADTRKLLGLLRQVNWQGNIVRSVSQHLYSCVGMVFANRRAWIDPDSLHRILREDGYTKLTNVENLSVGDVVLYHLQGKPVHVGVVTEVSKENGHIIGTRVLSKWGRAGEIEHSVNAVPEFCGQLHSYWSERVHDDI